MAMTRLSAAKFSPPLSSAKLDNVSSIKSLGTAARMGSKMLGNGTSIKRAEKAKRKVMRRKILRKK